MRFLHYPNFDGGGGLAGRVGPVLRWLPFGLLLAWCLGQGMLGSFVLDLTRLWWAGLVWVAWLVGKRLWPLALLFSLALAPLAWQVGGTGVAGALARLPPGAYLRLEGTVRRVAVGRWQGSPRMELLLGEVWVMTGEASFGVPEVVVRFPVGGMGEPRLYRRRVRVGGELVALRPGRGAPLLDLARAGYHRQAAPVSPTGGEGLRTALAARAGYYLGAAPLAVYQPVVLGVRKRGSPEAWRVAGVANRVGIAHLFAISGLHIGLLFFIFLGAAHFLLGWALRGQGWLRARAWCKVGVLALIWGYIALIGFPIPAVRAAVMGTMLVWADLWGTRTPRLYILLLAGLVLLAFAPTSLYDLSFQLSFLGYFFLVCALGLADLLRGEGAPAGGRGRLHQGWLAAWGMVRANLWVTLWITLGVWPLIALKFGNFSLLVFLGNLVMIPLLSTVVLPAGLVALGTSWFFLGEPPGGLLERVVFGGLEAVLRVWLAVADAIEWAGAPLVFPVRLAWRPQHIFLYYAFVLGAVLLLGQLKKGPAGAGPEPLLPGK